MEQSTSYYPTSHTSSMSSSYHQAPTNIQHSTSSSLDFTIQPYSPARVEPVWYTEHKCIKRAVMYTNIAKVYHVTPCLFLQQQTWLQTIVQPHPNTNKTEVDTKK